MDQELLMRVALAEAALLVITFLALVGHAGWVALRARRQRPHLAMAADTLAAALEGVNPAPGDLDDLAALSANAQIGVFSQLATSLQGAQGKRLTEVAAKVGLVAKAERWCVSKRWGRRLRGARTLTMLGSGQGVVSTLLDDPRAEVRSQAVQWAADHPEAAPVDRLLRMLRDPEALCRFTVKDSLLRMGSTATEPLLRYVSAPGQAPAPEALEVAAGIADVRFLDPALALCGASSARTRALAATLVGSVGGSRGTEALTALLSDADPSVRTSAAKALAKLGHWPAASRLAECLRDPSWDVRRAAAITLRGFWPTGVLLLRRALSDSDRFARDMARQVLDLPGAGGQSSAQSTPAAREAEQVAR